MQRKSLLSTLNCNLYFILELAVMREVAHIMAMKYSNMFQDKAQGTGQLVY